MQFLAATGEVLGKPRKASLRLCRETSCGLLLLELVPALKVRFCLDIEAALDIKDVIKGGVNALAVRGVKSLSHTCTAVVVDLKNVNSCSFTRRDHERRVCSNDDLNFGQRRSKSRQNLPLPAWVEVSVYFVDEQNARLLATQFEAVQEVREPA